MAVGRPAAAGLKECGNAGTLYGGEVHLVNVTTKRVGCTKARRFVRSFEKNSGDETGFRCSEDFRCIRLTALITGANVKNNSLTGKDVKSRSLQKADLSRSAVRSLKGARGFSGSQGPQGPASSCCCDESHSTEQERVGELTAFAFCAPSGKAVAASVSKAKVQSRASTRDAVQRAMH